MTQESGYNQKAREWYEKAFTITKKLAKACDGTLDQRWLGINYINLGDLALKDNDRQAARSWYKQAGTILEQLTQTCGKISNYDDLTVIFYKLSVVSTSKQERKHLAERGFAYSKALYQQTGLPKYQARMNGFHRILKSKLSWIPWWIACFLE